MKPFLWTLVPAAYLILCIPAEGQSPSPTPTGTAGGTEGLVLAWGENHFGQLGNGKTTAPDWRKETPFNPTPVPSLAKITAVAAAAPTRAAVDNSGAIWVWGGTIFAPLKDGAPVLGTPVKVPGLADVIAVSVGPLVERPNARLAEHALALKAAGTVWAWGRNALGELGRDQGASDKPIQVPGLTGVCAIAAGTVFSMALKSDGTVWAWGNNQCGQLGNGGFDKQATAHGAPAMVPGLKKIVAIAVGESHCLALDSDGRIWGWGLNGKGVLGRPQPPMPDPPPDSMEALQAYVDTCKSPTPAVIDKLPKIKTIGTLGPPPDDGRRTPEGEPQTGG